MMINKIWSFRNWLDFNLRQKIHWRRKGLRLPNTPKMNVFNHLEESQKAKAKEIEKRLANAYDLTDIEYRGDQENYRVNLYYLEFIERAFREMDVHLPGKIEAADVGCSSWFYGRALWALLTHWESGSQNREVHLSGYEVDAFRPYFNWYTRYDYAQAFTKKLKNVVYRPQPFKTQNSKYDVICQFFPFIFIKDHLEWGLPDGYFSPEALLVAIWQSLKPNGILLIINQGQAEHEAQKDLLNKIGIAMRTSFRVDSVFCDYPIDHFVIGAVKRG